MNDNDRWGIALCRGLQVVKWTGITAPTHDSATAKLCSERYCLEASELGLELAVLAIPANRRRTVQPVRVLPARRERRVYQRRTSLWGHLVLAVLGVLSMLATYDFAI